MKSGAAVPLLIVNTHSAAFTCRPLGAVFKFQATPRVYL